MTVDDAGSTRGCSDSSCCCSWSREEDRAFENAIASWEEGDGGNLDWTDLSQLWVRLAGELPDKSLEEIRCHYEVLVEDVRSIEDGRVEIPSYNGGFEGLNGGGVDGKEGCLGNGGGGGKETGKVSKSEHERRRGIAWTEEEHRSKNCFCTTSRMLLRVVLHTRCDYLASAAGFCTMPRLFLLGLEKFGKGDWRSISRHFVISRTPTQVASHAQKYFIRLNSVNKDRRRSSIHDATSVDARDISTSHDPIAHQLDGTLGTGGGSRNHSKGSPPSIGKPVDGPFQSLLNMPHHLGDVNESSTDGKI